MYMEYRGLVIMKSRCLESTLKPAEAYGAQVCDVSVQICAVGPQILLASTVPARPVHWQAWR